MIAWRGDSALPRIAVATVDLAPFLRILRAPVGVRAVGAVTNHDQAELAYLRAQPVATHVKSPESRSRRHAHGARRDGAHARTQRRWDAMGGRDVHTPHKASQHCSPAVGRRTVPGVHPECMQLPPVFGPMRLPCISAEGRKLLSTLYRRDYSVRSTSRRTSTVARAPCRRVARSRFRNVFKWASCSQDLPGASARALAFTGW